MAENEKDTTTFGLTSKKVARLLKLGAESPDAKIELDDEQRQAELLHDRLAETLALCEVQVSDATRGQTRMSNAIAALSGAPIGGLLLAPRTDLDVLKKIKDLGRKLSEAAESKPEHRVANTIYYAAIAAALQIHHARITSFSYKELLSTFSTLAKEGWIPRDLVSLFERASSICGELTNK